MVKIKIKILREREKLKGGAGDNRPDSAFDPKQLAIGIGDETGEHTPNKAIGKEIAKDHLTQDPDYYRKLKDAGIDESNLNEEGEDIKKRQVIAWKNSRWMFLDTETTGLPPDRKNPNRKDPRVVQIGYAIVDNMKVVEVFNRLVDPGEDIEIDPSAAAVTGIDREKLRSSKAQNFLSVIQKIKKDMESCSIIMSYNNKFDKPVVEREFKIANIDMPVKPWLDPMVWVMKHLQLPDHKLKTVATHYKISLDNAHDAGADSEAAAKVTMAFVQAFDGLPDDADEVVTLQGKWNSELSAARLAAWRKKNPQGAPQKISWKKKA